MTAPGAPLRVGLVQTVLPSYRLPVFTALARRPEIDLTLYLGRGAKGSSLPTVSADGAFQVVDAPNHAFGGLFVQPGAVRAALLGAHDVVVLPWTIRSLELLPAIAAARARGLGVVLWGHGYSKTESAARRRARNLVGRAGDATLFYSRAAADRCQAEGFDPARVFVAANAIDQAPIAEARAAWPTAEVDAFRTAQGLVERSAGGGTLLFVSRLEPDKRVDLLIDAFAHLLRRRPRSRLVIVGDGSDTERLRAHARAAEVDAATHFVGPVYDERALAGWFLASDVFTYPVAIGLSVLHAFGYGLPVVTSDDIASHNPEIDALEPGRNGLLYRDGDTGDFAARVESLLTDDALHRALAEGARASVEGPRGFTLERMVDGFVDAITSTVR